MNSLAKQSPTPSQVTMRPRMDFECWDYARQQRQDQSSGDLIYKTFDPAPAEPAEPEMPFTQLQLDAIGGALSEIRHQLRIEHKAAAVRLRQRIDKLNDEVASLRAELRAHKNVKPDVSLSGEVTPMRSRNVA
jgi:hypothetical protein